MAFEIPYHKHTLRPVNDMIPGNEESESPVEFDLVPAWGGDLARLRSIVTACIGLVQADDWNAGTQNLVVESFKTGSQAFDSTITAIRNLSIPADMAKRAGLLPETAGDASVPITTGEAFSQIASGVSAMALHVAMEIVKLSSKADKDIRLFESPSGSGGPATTAATGSSAASARKRPRRRGTAARRSTKRASQT